MRRRTPTAASLTASIAMALSSNPLGLAASCSTARTTNMILIRRGALVSIHRRSTRLLAVVGLLAFTMAASPALAAPSSRIISSEVNLGCDLLSGGSASAYLAAGVGEGGSGASLQVWIVPANPISDAPILVNGDASLTLSADGSALEGGIDLMELESGAAAGTAILDATLTPSGTAETVERTATGSNHKGRVVDTHQPLTVSGSLSLPTGDVLVLDGRCTGVSTLTESFANAPASTVTSTDFIGLSCDWYLVDGSYVGLVGQSDQLTSWLDIAVVTPEGSFPDPDGAESLSLTRSQIEASFDLTPAGQGIAPTGGTARATARVWNGERLATAEGEAGRRSRTTINSLVVDGTLNVSLDDGTSYVLAMNAETCRMADISHRTIEGGNN